MPFTPFHFGAHACTVLPFQRKLDVPVFILSNVFIDIEPLAVMLFNLNYPLHGYAHTFLGGLVAGSLGGVFVYWLRKPMGKAMGSLGLYYKPTVILSMISGVLGAWLHILFDACIYSDIKPFYPISNNPLYGLISPVKMYILCALFFIPAIVLYLMVRNKLQSR
ncbi:MAG TPA: hydrolase [Candidatus Omnitrophica bacterium]|nr:MAG: hypothetical protein A2Z81_04195 [Omnitrophica WOR_2 bacterium GWA2_45_18]HBR15432.1 hydrolase [Candidatus Omnitrophota bacterium]